MSKPETFESKLKAIRERVENATPGPWWIDSLTTEQAEIKSNAGFDCTVRNPKDFESLDQTENTAEFIAHSRTDIEKLLAVVDKLIEQRDKLALFSPAPPTIVKDEMNTELAKLLGDGE